MSVQNLTIKSQEILQQAQQLAFNEKNTNIESEHILKALLNDKDSPIEFLLKKNNVNVNYLEEKLGDAIQKLPKVSHGEPAQSLSREANNILLRSSVAIKTFSDEFVSVEHLLLAILQGSDNTAKLLKDAGLNEKGLITAIKDLRKGSTISSQTSETQFNALNKYAKKVVPITTKPVHHQIAGVNVDQLTSFNSAKPNGITMMLPNKNTHFIIVIG